MQIATGAGYYSPFCVSRQPICPIFAIINYILFLFPDYVSDLFGSSEEYDILMRTWYVSDVRRSDHGLPHLPQASRKAYTSLLNKNNASNTNIFVSYHILYGQIFFQLI